MAYYFGFLPSDSLNQAINTASTAVQDYQSSAKSSQKLYTHRNTITQLINKELLDVMLVQMVESLPDESERKTQLRKISQTIEATANKLVTTLLSPTDDKDVLPSFDFLHHRSLFEDKNQQRRVGFKLSDSTASQLLDGFELVKQGKKEQALPKLTDGFSGLAAASLQHFLVDFTQTLKLGTLKKATIPVADSVINKGINVAIHKLLPQLPIEGLERIANYYDSMIFEQK